MVVDELSRVTGHITHYDKMPIPPVPRA